MIDQFIAGEFNLTPGSLISCHPAQYGLAAVYHTQGDLFRLFPLLNMTESDSGTPAHNRLSEKIDGLSQRYHLDHYPWAGAISTHHSFLYLLDSGQRVFAQPWPGPPLKKHHKGSSASIQLKFSTEACQSRELSFMTKYLSEALQPNNKTLVAPLSFKHFNNSLQK
jgi:hypothetical protein